jgi:hypothetical protein
MALTASDIPGEAVRSPPQRSAGAYHPARQRIRRPALPLDSRGGGVEEGYGKGTRMGNGRDDSLQERHPCASVGCPAGPRDGCAGRRAPGHAAEARAHPPPGTGEAHTGRPHPAARRGRAATGGGGADVKDGRRM